MSFFKKLFGSKNNTNNKMQYLSGWEVILDGGEECTNFIQTQLVDEQVAKNLRTYVELSFGEDNLLNGAKLFSDGKQEKKGYLVESLEIGNAIGKLAYQDFPVNKIYSLEKSSKGKSYFGGNVPETFTIPENKCPSSFQYLGKVSREDAAFTWLPFDVHLICPIYLDIDRVWVDYSNPLQPICLNKKEVEEVGTAYDDLKDDSFIIFEKKNFESKKIGDYTFDLGIAGVPNWIQNPEIPICPKSKKPMKFLCQFGDYAGVKTAETNVKPEKDWYKQYFEEMNFWSDGDLFVFFEPETKIACYFIQKT